MRHLRWLVVATAALVVSSVALGTPAAGTVTVTGSVQGVTQSAITVAGTTCAIAPTNPRMMMPAIIRNVGVGDSVTMACARASGRLVLTKLVERPAGTVVVRGTVSSATQSSITIRGVTCTFTVTGFPNPRIMAPTIVRGDQALMACLRQQGQLAVTALTELHPHAGQTILVLGNVSAKSTSSITVAGVTCTLARNTKPLPGMPTFLKGVDVGDHVLMACTQVGGTFVLTGVADR